MRYRIEIQNKQGWRPAIRSTPTSLDPERASTYESAEVAFADAKKVQAARPLAAVRIVEAESGVMVWALGSGDHAGEVFGLGPNTTAQVGPVNAVFLNGDPADTTTLEGKPVRPQPSVTHGDGERLHLEIPLRNLPPKEASEAFVADACRKFLNVLAPEVLDSVRQIIAAQEEIVGGCVTLHELAARKEATLHMRTRLENETEQALYAAQEILTNLRALAKRLGL